MDRPECFGRFFSALQGKTGEITDSAGGWSARCPVHDDEKQSLSIRIGSKNQLMVKCHAPSCAQFSSKEFVRRVIESLGLSFSDLYEKTGRSMPHASTEKQPGQGRANPMSEPSTQAVKPKFVCRYEYKDENGKLLYACMRFDPKGFSQARANPAFDPSRPAGPDNKTFVPGLDGVRLVPYKLPECLALLKENPRRAIIIVEGEKDADELHKLGFAGTTNPMGAGKWRAEYNTMMKDRTVFIIPDNDEPGINHAHQVADSLLGTAKQVKIMILPGLPPKGDFSDWLKLPEQAGLNPEGLRLKMLGLGKDSQTWDGSDEWKKKKAEEKSVVSPPVSPPVSSTVPPVVSPPVPPTVTPTVPPVTTPQPVAQSPEIVTVNQNVEATPATYNQANADLFIEIIRVASRSQAANPGRVRSIAETIGQVGVCHRAMEMALVPAIQGFKIDHQSYHHALVMMCSLVLAGVADAHSSAATKTILDSIWKDINSKK